MTIARRWVAETTLSTWTVSEAWADALKPGRRGRAAAIAGAARGRERLMVAESGVEPRLGWALQPIYGLGNRRVSVRFLLHPPSSRASGGAELLGGRRGRWMGSRVRRGTVS